MAVFSVLWSEHCGYKHSAPLLGRLPSAGERVLQGPGGNAGVLDLGDGLAVAFKVESQQPPVRRRAVSGRRNRRRRHPPRHRGDGRAAGGAARRSPLRRTRLALPAGRRRDRALRQLRRRAHRRRRMRLRRGLRRQSARQRDVRRPAARRAGAPGAGAGRRQRARAVRCADGSRRHRRRLRPSVAGPRRLGREAALVQIGDPFRGKALIEVSLELVEHGLVVALQDCGAAGLASSLSEMAADGFGVDVHLDRVPLREAGLEPWEIMISESQERMVAVVAPDRVGDVRAACERWELPCTVIGEVAGHGELRVFFDDETVGMIPAAYLTDLCPRYEVATSARPTASAPVDPVNDEPKTWVFEQYDHLVGSSTVRRPGSRRGRAADRRYPRPRRLTRRPTSRRA